MTKFEHEAEINFYENLKETTMEEFSEMPEIKSKSGVQIEYSDLRRRRLQYALDLFNSEIEDNLPFYENNQKINRLECYRTEAKKRMKNWQKTYSQHLNKENKYPHLQIANENIQFIGRLILKLESKLGNLKNQSPHNTPTIENLKELFVDDSAFNLCMEALRTVMPPVISDDNRYLLGPNQKSAFTAWFEVLKLRQKFKSTPATKIFAKLLNEEIYNLKLGADGSTLNRGNTTMYKKYYVPFTKLIE